MDDNEALLALARSCPMSAGITMFSDRAPDYFALSRAQSEKTHVAVIDDRQGKVAGTAMMAEFPEIFLDGEVAEALYAGDLKVRPDRRSGLLMVQLYSYLFDWSVHDFGSNLAFTTVMKNNPLMKAVVENRSSRVPKYHYVSTMRNYTVQYLFSKRPPKEIEVRCATPGDVAEMIPFWNRVQSDKQFAPYWTTERFTSQLARSPGLELSDYYLAFRNGRLTGLLAAWDQSPIKRMIVLKYNAPELRRMQRWYNPLASVLGLARMPGPEQAMPYFYATHLAAETAEDLAALYTAVYNATRDKRYLFISTMLDIRDPLNEALKNFFTRHVDIELYALEGRRRWSPTKDLAYFDPSLV